MGTSITLNPYCCAPLAGDKVQAVAAYRDKTIVRFGAKNSRFPQGCTDYERWTSESVQYEVAYCNRCDVTMELRGHRKIKDVIYLY